MRTLLGISLYIYKFLFQKSLSNLDWDCIFGNCIRLLRISLFTSLEEKPPLDVDIAVLKDKLENLFLQYLPSKFFFKFVL